SPYTINRKLFSQFRKLVNRRPIRKICLGGPRNASHSRVSPRRRKDTVPSIQFDILRRHLDGSLLWLEAAANLKVAKCRLQQLHAVSPGDYFVYDQGSQQIVARSAELDG